MAEFEVLTRFLTSDGGAPGLDNEGTYFIFTDDGNLTLKLHTGEHWDSEEILAEDVRPGSSACYLLSPLTKLIIYIDNTSHLRVLKYDGDEEEWMEDSAVPKIAVHAEGKLTGVTAGSKKEKFFIFFQDPSNRLVVLDDSWTSSTLPAQAASGTALGTSRDLVGDTFRVSYTSAQDLRLHQLVQGGGGWVDEVTSDFEFKDPIKRLVTIVQATPEGAHRDTYILTESRAVVRVSTDGSAAQLGTVDASGTYIPKSAAQSIVRIWLPGGTVIDIYC